MKNVRSRQPCVSMNFCTESSSFMWVSLTLVFNKNQNPWDQLINSKILIVLFILPKMANASIKVKKQASMGVL